MSGSANVIQPGAVELIFNAVERILRSSVPDQPDTARISLKGEHSVISGDNMLTDRSAAQVHLNPGTQVDDTIRARAAAIGPRDKWPGTPDGKQ
jgi:predicted acyltransferase (DUF342 family)